MSLKVEKEKTMIPAVVVVVVVVVVKGLKKEVEKDVNLVKKDVNLDVKKSDNHIYFLIVIYMSLFSNLFGTNKPKSDIDVEDGKFHHPTKKRPKKPEKISSNKALPNENKCSKKTTRTPQKFEGLAL